MRWLARSVCLPLFVAAYGPASAEEPHHVHIETQITMIFTGFDADQFGIHTVEPTKNVAKCDLPGPNAGYATNSDHPGFRTLYAAALLAFAERATVNVVVSEKEGDCVAGRPRIIGLNILR
jgi:hypothetical protein